MDPNLLAAVQAAAEEDDDDDDGLIYEEIDGESATPSQASLHGYMSQQYAQPQQPPQMQTTVTLNINGQSVPIVGGQEGVQANHAGAAMGNIPHLNNLQQLTNIIDSINPYLSQQHQGQQQVDAS